MPKYLAQHLPKLHRQLLDGFAQYRQQLLGRRVWLACSGGRDSMALAHACQQLYVMGSLPFLPCLLHVNHGLQADSSSWAEQVASWAAAVGMMCQVLEVTVAGSDEQTARDARYAALYAQMRQHDVLLLAHHADDQAETVLLRLLQGAGVNGLAAMQSMQAMVVATEQAGQLPNVAIHPSNHHSGYRINPPVVTATTATTVTTATKTVWLWRPWLSVSREAITTFAGEHQLAYIDDPTNMAGGNARSWLRRDILPRLVARYPQAVASMCRSADLLADAHDTLMAQAHQDLDQLQSDPCSRLKERTLLPYQSVISVTSLQQLPPARQRQVLHLWLQADEPLPPSHQLVTDVLALAHRSDPDHQTQLDWQGAMGSYRIRRYRDCLYRHSEGWLDWLDTPIAEYRIDLQALAAEQQPAVVAATNSAQNHAITFDLRTVNVGRHGDRQLTWQLGVDWGLWQLLTSHCQRLSIQPLHRQQRIQLKPNAPPQSGKKLYQTLAIPTWLRRSVAVLSVDEVVVAVLLPWQTYVLPHVFASLTRILNDSEQVQLDVAFGNLSNSCHISMLH